MPPRRQRRRAALGAGQRRALLVVHRRPAGQRRSAPRRRDRPDRSDGPARPMPVEAIAGKMLSEHGELTAVVTILHDRREALEKARAVRAAEAGVRRAASGKSRRRPPTSRTQNELLRRQAIELEQASRAEVAVPRQHVARVPDAAQRDARLHVDAAAGRRRADRAAGVKRQLGRDRLERPAPADDHQRDSRHLPHRGGPDAAADLARSTCPSWSPR